MTRRRGQLLIWGPNFLLLFLIFIVFNEMRGKLLSSYGLLLDAIGVVQLWWSAEFTKRLDQMEWALSGYKPMSPEFLELRTQERKEKKALSFLLNHDPSTGALLIALGFTVQIAGIWF